MANNMSCQQILLTQASDIIGAIALGQPFAVSYNAAEEAVAVQQQQEEQPQPTTQPGPEVREGFFTRCFYYGARTPQERQKRRKQAKNVLRGMAWVIGLAVISVIGHYFW